MTFCSSIFLLLYSKPSLFHFASDWRCKSWNDEFGVRWHCKTRSHVRSRLTTRFTGNGAVLAIGFGVLITSFLHIATLRKNKATATGFTMFALPYASFIMTAIMRPIFIPLGKLAYLRIV